MSIDTQLEKMLRKVEKPARYTGGEQREEGSGAGKCTFWIRISRHLRDRHVVHGHADFIQYIEQE